MNAHRFAQRHIRDRLIVSSALERYDSATARQYVSSTVAVCEQQMDEIESDFEMQVLNGHVPLKLLFRLLSAVARSCFPNKSSMHERIARLKSRADRLDHEIMALCNQHLDSSLPDNGFTGLSRDRIQSRLDRLSFDPAAL